MAINSIFIALDGVPTETPYVLQNGFATRFLGDTSQMSVRLEAGAQAEGLAPGVDIAIDADAADLTFFRNGTKLEVQEADGDIVLLSMQANTQQATRIVFNDLQAELTADSQDGGRLLLADTVITEAGVPGTELIPDTEAPTIAAGQTFSITENSPAATEVTGGAVGADDNVGVVAFAIDPESDDGGLFAIAPNGQLSITAAGAENIDFEGETQSYTLDVTATDAAGNPSEAVEVTVNVTNDPTDDPADEEAPVVQAEQSFSVTENGAAGPIDGAMVLATDNVGVAAYEIVDGGEGYFEIDDAGQLSLTADGAENIDFEGAVKSYTLTVTASDLAGKTSAPVEVTVNVTNDPTDDETGVVDLSEYAGGSVQAQAGVAEIFVYEFTVVDDRAVNVGDGDVQILGFDRTEDMLRFDDLSDTLTTETFMYIDPDTEAAAFPGVRVYRNPFGEKSTAVIFNADPDTKASGSVELLGVLVPEATKLVNYINYEVV